MFFLPYQQRWIADGSPIKIMEKSRQIGMSWTAAYRAVRTTAVAGQRSDTWVASRDELQARLFLEDCQKWARIVHEAGQGELGVLAPGRPGGGHVFFANGCAIHGLSSNIDAQAGKRGARILDEFALHPDPRRLYAVAYPGVTWGGQLEIISTHRGSNNFFNQLVREAREGGNPKRASLPRVTLEDALRQGLLEKLKQTLAADDPRQALDLDAYLQYTRDGCPDEETWLQEYCCVPADDASAFLPCDLIDAAAMPEAEAGGRLPLPRIRSIPRPLYLGVDVGRDHDLTVLWLVEDHDGTLITRQLVCLQGMPFSAQEEQLYELMALPTLRRCAIDATGIGRQFAERAQQRFGANRVEAVTLSAPVKEALAYPVRTALENRTLQVPPDPLVRSDLRAIRKESSRAGTARFTADRGRNGHADRFWALALCLHAARHSRVHKALHCEVFGSAKS